MIRSNEDKVHGMIWESKSLFLQESPACSQRTRVKRSCSNPRSTPESDSVHTENGHDVGINTNTEIVL